jgi:hypothetical protein
MSWDWLLGGTGKPVSNMSNAQKELLRQMTQNAINSPNGFPGEGNFMSSFGHNVPDLTSGQLQSLAGLEAMGTNPQGEMTSTEKTAGKTLEDIMGRSPASPEWQKWFQDAVTNPGLRDLEQNDITRGRQFGDTGTFFSSDRVNSDNLGRQAFWDSNSMARGSAAMSNEQLRAQAAGIVPSLRTPTQAGQEMVNLYSSLIKGQDVPRQVESAKIQSELDNFMRNLALQQMWREYNLNILRTPKYDGMTAGSSGLIGPLLGAAASYFGASGGGSGDGGGGGK